MPDSGDLRDKQALYELVCTYCRAVDRRDYLLVRSLYHDDAIDDHGRMFYGTADEYVAWLPGVLAGMESTVHSVANALFVIEADQAQGEIYATAYHRTYQPGARELVIGGRYLDRYAKRAGQWKFLHRSLVLDWAKSASADDLSDAGFGVGAPAGCAGTQDPSYQVLSFFKRFGSA
jgi:hypothetical protein